MSCMPSAADLLYLRLLTRIFPSSDFRHNVLTPALLLVGECLARTPVTGARDLAAGLFLAELVLGFSKDSKRVVPELLLFLQAALDKVLNLPKSEGGRLHVSPSPFFSSAKFT